MRRLGLLVLLAVGCGRAPAWSVTAVDRHAEVDRLIEEGNRAGARQVLERMLATVPERGPADTRRVLLQDTHFRLARLALDANQPAEAARHAETGLALGGSDDLFVANLLVARGAAHEALGETAAALQAYQRALRINETLLQHTLRSP